MSDINSSLPVRTENAGDVVIKVADATTPAQQLTVEADGSINVNFAAGAEIKITDGTDDLAINADGSINAVVTATNLDIRDLTFANDKVDASGSSVSITGSVTVTDGGGSLTVDANNLDIRDLAFATDKVDVTGSSVGITGSVTVTATDLDIRNLAASQDNVAISDGTDSLAINTDGSINVKIVDGTPGTSINDYNTVASVAGGATSTHTYTSTGNFYLTQIEATGSGRLKIEVQVNGTTRFVQFNSEANPNMQIVVSQPILATSGQTVTVIRTNRANQAYDVYSTISGYNE